MSTGTPRATITELTRRDIFDLITAEGIAWWGRLDENVFLGQLWDLKAMPSEDPRFQTAADDFWQHRINNDDWPDDWIFTDSRLNLLHCDDETFLRFLCEMVHPVVRPGDETGKLVQQMNEKLAADGWALAATKQMSGRPIYEPRRAGKQPSTALRLQEYQRLRDPRVVDEHVRAD